jgi:hypothetical protein
MIVPCSFAVYLLTDCEEEGRPGCLLPFTQAKQRLLPRLPDLSTRTSNVDF